MRKLLLLARKDKTDESFEQKLTKFAGQNNDSLRYTFIFPIEKYAEGFQNALENLRLHGYTIQQNRIWNAWKNTQTAKDTGYRGINATVISSQNQIFELQFHTAESFRLKTKTHHFYEQLRDLKTPDERRIEIIAEMLRLTKEVERPKGI